MVYRHYNLNLWYRIALLLIFAGLTGFAIAQKQLYILALSGVCEIIVVGEFIRFLNKTHRQMNYFIKAIKNEDTTLRFPSKTGNSIINELHQSLNELNGILQKVQLKSRIKEKYFSEILQHIATGVVVLTDKGFVTDVNAAAMELIGLETFTHIDQLKRIDSRFALALSEIKNRERKVLDILLPKERIQVITRCSVIRLEEEEVKLITLQDIRGELERKEVDAWIKLIRVLSHEIMNSLAPVTSIAQSLQSIWMQKTEGIANNLPDEEVEKTINGLGVITEMSEGLIRFVKSYRVLSKAPQPVMTSIAIHSFFDRLNILLSPLREDFQGKISLQDARTNFHFIADEQMLVQVIINLVKNATEAINGMASRKDSFASIVVSAIQKGQITEIRVRDNGQGIPAEIADEIFIPFFTTKENGSGIGLSYSRQMLRAHGGSLISRSRPGETVFTVRW